MNSSCQRAKSITGVAKLVFLLFAATLTLLGILTRPTSAFSGAYFKNTPDNCHYDLGGLYNNSALNGSEGEDMGNDSYFKEKFISFIKSADYPMGAESPHSSHQYDEMVRAYIVLSMLGVSPQTYWVIDAKSAYYSLVSQWETAIRDNNVHMKIISYPSTNNTSLCAYNEGNVYGKAGSGYSSALAFYLNYSDYLNNTNPVYVIKINCMNPLGNGLPGLNWSINGQSYISTTSQKPTVYGDPPRTITANPGDTLYWFHDLRNKNDSTATASINRYTIDRNYGTSIGSDGWDTANHDPQGYNVTGAPGDLFVTLWDPLSDANLRYNVTNADVGKTICQRINWNPASSSSSIWGHSGEACARIEESFNLVPDITSDKTSATPGENIKLDSGVRNTGGFSSQGTQWCIKRENTATKSCGGSIASGTDNFSVGRKALSSIVAQIPIEAKIGDQVCYVLSVNPSTNGNPDSWAHAKVCISIGKKPKVQIWGGDLRTHGYVNTSVSSLANRVYGSWSEYAVLVSGNNTGFGSGAARYGGTTDNCAVRLTLNNANDASATCNGNASNITGYNSAKIGDMVANFNFEGAPSLSGSVSANSLSSGNYVASGDITLNQSLNLNKGKSVVIKVNGKVTINGNQTYTNNGYNSISDIPQLVIIANEIIINDDVTQVDGWLIAKGGSIKTCSKEARSINECNKSLTINGPVVADKLYLYRTAGAEPGSLDEPAEKFNLRADALLWAYNYASTNRPIKTVYNTELPPRL